MSEDLSGAVHLATLEKAHRQAIEDVMQSNMGDVERVVKVLALEAEYLGGHGEVAGVAGSRAHRQAAGKRRRPR